MKHVFFTLWDRNWYFTIILITKTKGHAEYDQQEIKFKKRY